MIWSHLRHDHTTHKIKSVNWSKWLKQCETHFCTLIKITLRAPIIFELVIVTRAVSYTMLSRFSFRRKVLFEPAEPLLRVEVDILWGKTLTGSSMWSPCSPIPDPPSSSFISQPVECARRPSRELDFIWNIKFIHQTHRNSLVNFEKQQKGLIQKFCYSIL